MKREYTISIAKANLIAFAMILPIAILLGLPMVVIHNYSIHDFIEIIKSVTVLGAFKFAIVVTIGIFVHELLHGLGWTIFAKKKWRAISFGIKWEFFTPYCHCNEPLKRFQFLVGAILPLIALGLMPVSYSFFTGNPVHWFFGFFFTIAAGGDIIAIWMLRKVRRGEMVQDHPSELGFVVVDE